MTKMLKLTDKDYNAAILTIIQEVKENVLITSEKIGILRREIKNVKTNQMESLGLKIRISEIMGLTNGFNSRMEMIN